MAMAANGDASFDLPPPGFRFAPPAVDSVVALDHAAPWLTGGGNKRIKRGHGAGETLSTTLGYKSSLAFKIPGEDGGARRWAISLEEHPGYQHLWDGEGGFGVYEEPNGEVLLLIADEGGFVEEHGLAATGTTAEPAGDHLQQPDTQGMMLEQQLLVMSSLEDDLCWWDDIIDKDYSLAIAAEQGLLGGNYWQQLLMAAEGADPF